MKKDQHRSMSLIPAVTSLVQHYLSRSKTNREMITTQGHETMQGAPIAAVRLAQGTKAIAIYDQGHHVLHAQQGDLPQGDTEDVSRRPRVLQLDDFDSLRVLQVGIDEGVQLRVASSIHTTPKRDFAIKATDMTHEVKTESTLTVSETDMLHLFAGDTGGIVVFSGFHLPEEHALLIEQTNGAEKKGILLFTRPSNGIVTEAMEADSAVGLNIFLEHMITQLEATSDTPLVKEAMTALRSSIETEKIDFGGSAIRQNIFRLQTLANAQLSSITQEQKYYDFLIEYVPQFPQSGIRRNALWLLYGNKQSPQQAVDSILIIGSKKQKEKKQEPPTFEEQVATRLQTEHARLLWGTVTQNRFHRTDNEVTRAFWNHLVHIIQTATTDADFADVQTLLTAMFDESHDYRYEHISFSYQPTEEIPLQFGPKNPKREHYQYRNVRTIKLQETFAVMIMDRHETLEKQKKKPRRMWRSS